MDTENLPPSPQTTPEAPLAAETEKPAATASQDTAGAAPQPAARPAPKKEPRPNFVVRFLAWWFDPDTRRGRFNRSASLWVGGFVGVFALGMLSTYLLLYRPLQLDAQQTQTSLKTAQQQLATVQDDLSKARQDLSGAQTQVAGLTASVASLKANVDLLQALSDVNLARLDLATHDTAGARTALAGTGDTLKSLAAFLQSKDASTAQSIQSRLALVLSELPGNPDTAASDLKILADQLGKLQSTYFSQP